MKEDEIRPKGLFDEYLELAKKDAGDFFGKVKRLMIDCPACSSSETARQFSKEGFDYELCAHCETLFVNPRPGKKVFEEFYLKAPSVKFWATKFYRETEKARRKLIFRPRAEMVLEKVERFSGLESIGWIADIGAGYGTFCEELTSLAPPGIVVSAIEPSPALADSCRSKDLSVIEEFMENVSPGSIPSGDGPLGVLTCFEMFEHLFSPEEFLRSVHSILGRNGLLILTTLSAAGLDIQVLWEKSKSVSPPHHLNFLIPSSIGFLLERSGFELLEVSTPGKLDVSILENNIDLIEDRFIVGFLRNSGEQTKREFQEFISRNNLSSHMMAVARKKG
jgi:SAM-dependent methyltransferase